MAAIPSNVEKSTRAPANGNESSETQHAKVDSVESATPDRSPVAHDILPVPGALEPLFPQGGLTRGQATACTRGSALAAILAAVTAAGHTVGIVGGARLGLLAMSEMGADLQRIYLVEPTAEELWTAVSILLEGLPVVVLDIDDLTVAPSRLRVIAAKMRNHRCALIVSGGRMRGIRPDLYIRTRPIRYHGIGMGRGRIQRTDFSIDSTSRPGQRRALELTCGDLGDGTVTWASPQPTPTSTRCVSRTA